MPLATVRLSIALTSRLVLSLPSVAMADDAPDGLTVSGAIRVRYEAIDGQARTGFNGSDDLLNIRTNILAEYRTGDVRLGVDGAFECHQSERAPGGVHVASFDRVDAFDERLRR